MNPVSIIQSNARRGGALPVRLTGTTGSLVVLTIAFILFATVTSDGQTPNESANPGSAGKTAESLFRARQQGEALPEALRLRRRTDQARSASTAASPEVGTQAATQNSSTQYSFVYINVPNSAYVQPNSINSLGTVVGEFADQSYNLHGFIWQNGALQQVDYSGALSTSLAGVNNLGQIVGIYEDTSYVTHVAFYSPSNSSWTELPALPGGFTAILGLSVGLNDEGEVLGCASAGIPALTWVWHPRSQSYTYFTASPASESTTCGSDFNEARAVVGTLRTADGGFTARPFLGDELGGSKVVQLPAADQGYLLAPIGINNLGAIAGTSATATAIVAFVRTPDGAFTIVNDAAWPQTYLTGLNDFGVLIGDVYNPTTGASPGFIAYPRN